jgi:hypothetical protein
MTVTEHDRVQALLDLVEHRVPARAAARALQAFPWDEEELVELTPGHVLRVLTEYQQARIDEEELSAWADAVEGRDDVGRASGRESLLNDALFEMSSPELFGPLDEVVPSLIARLREPDR